MEGERIRRALSRIEAAAARLERAAARPPVQSAADLDIERKFRTLRHEAGTALAELDRLIGALEP
jgi:hypothetical protein